MTTATQQSQSSSGSQSGAIQTEGFDVKNIKSIQLPDGWHNVQNCEFVHFAIAEAHSPVVPSKLYPSLRYRNAEGNTVRTPLNKILSYSDAMSTSPSD